MDEGQGVAIAPDLFLIPVIHMIALKPMVEQFPDCVRCAGIITLWCSTELQYFNRDLSGKLVPTSSVSFETARG